MRYTEVHTIREFITYCKSILAKHPERMKDKDQQGCAGAIVVLMGNDEYHREWQKHPQIVDILEEAVYLDRLDYSWGGWNRISRLVAELQEQIGHATN
jgi:hypothetical protein